MIKLFFFFFAKDLFFLKADIKIIYKKHLQLRVNKSIFFPNLKPLFKKCIKQKYIVLFP